MARMVLLLLLAVAGVLHICQAVAAEIKHESFKDDPRHCILLDRFSSGGHSWVSISVTGANTSSTLGSPDPSLLGFFLLSDEMLFAAISLKPQPLPPNFESPSCVLSSPCIIPFFTFADLDNDGHYNKTFPITHAGEYSIFFASCAPETKVTMDVRTRMYNGDPAGRRSQGLLPLRRRHGLRPQELI
ncbi:unnamed protein product [Urochloa humidicola]